MLYIYIYTNHFKIFLLISYLQQGAYPLVAPRNESFPQTYITTRHNLFKLIFNQTLTNPLIQLINPPIGTWYAMVKKIFNYYFFNFNIYNLVIC